MSAGVALARTVGGGASDTGAGASSVDAGPYSCVHLPASVVCASARLGVWVAANSSAICVISPRGTARRRLAGLVELDRISPELAEALHLWLRVRAKIDTSSNRFFIKKTGDPITKHVIRFKLQRLAAKIPDLDITPHGLRRTFATLQENRGMPWSLMKVSLGHSDIKTTQGYIMSDERQAVEWLKGKREEEHTPPAPAKPKAPAIPTEW